MVLKVLLHSTNLVDEVLAVIVTQILCPDHSMKIRLHQFLDEVDFLEVLERGGLNDIENGDDLQASLKISAVQRPGTGYLRYR